MKRLLMIRHGQIHHRWQGCCYGASDIGLGPKGRAQSRRLARRLAPLPISAIYASDLRRSAYLARLIAEVKKLPVSWTPALRERDFGDWEKQTWNDIYARTGNDMEGMIHDPEHWRPPRGETTFELRDRVLAWYRSVDSSSHTTATVVAVTHGGPIAALVGSLRGSEVTEWPSLSPDWGAWVEIPGTSV